MIRKGSVPRSASHDKELAEIPRRELERSGDICTEPMMESNRRSERVGVGWHIASIVSQGWHLNPNSWHISGLETCAVAKLSFTRYQKIIGSKSATGGLGAKDRAPDLLVLALFNRHCVDSKFRRSL